MGRHACFSCYGLYYRNEYLTYDQYSYLDGMRYCPANSCQEEFQKDLANYPKVLKQRKRENYRQRAISNMTNVDLEKYHKKCERKRDEKNILAIKHKIKKEYKHRTYRKGEYRSCYLKESSRQIEDYYFKKNELNRGEFFDVVLNESILSKHLFRDLSDIIFSYCFHPIS